MPRITDRLDISTLKQCRLVCKNWSALNKGGNRKVSWTIQSHLPLSCTACANLISITIQDTIRCVPAMLNKNVDVIAAVVNLHAWR